MSNSEESKKNEVDEKLEKVVVEETSSSCLQKESDQENDTDLQKDDKETSDSNEIKLEELLIEDKQDH